MNETERGVGEAPGGHGAAGDTVEVPATLSAFGAPPGEAVVSVQHRSLGARVGRAALALGVAWILAFPAIFFPVVHFVLVPGLVVGGVVLAGFRLTEAQTLARVRGVCPRCHATLDLAPGGRFRLPRVVQCGGCRNELTLAAPAGAAP